MYISEKLSKKKYTSLAIPWVFFLWISSRLYVCMYGMYIRKSISQGLIPLR